MQTKFWVILAAICVVVAGCAPQGATGNVAVGPTEYGDDDG